MPIAVTISSNLGSFQGGTYTIGPMIVSSAFPSKQSNSLTFTGPGYQGVDGPQGATGVVIVPPASNLVAIQLKGAQTDIGIPIASNQPTLIPFGTPTIVNGVGLESAGPIAGVVTCTFF
jgi:hypothetical protein